MTRQPGSRIDHHELLEHLADGAQAAVHQAKDVRTGEEVVVKFPHARVLDHLALARPMAEKPSSPKPSDTPTINGRHRLAFADAFAVATANAHDAVLLTGDPGSRRRSRLGGGGPSPLRGSQGGIGSDWRRAQPLFMQSDRMLSRVS